MASPEQSSLDPRLVNRVGALAARVDEAVLTATAAYRDVTASHPEALTALLNFAEGERADTLQRALALSQPATAHLIAKLEERGLIQRRPDPHDARASRVHLTPAGRALATRMLDDRLAAISGVLGGLSVDDQRTCLAVVDAILERGTTSGNRARRTCRSCDKTACDHPFTCPVTAGADRWREATDP